jgi:hypothetical protein
VIFNQVVEKSGSDIGSDIPEINNVALNLEHKISTTGFRIIMDQAQGSILVSGTDGFVYLVDSEEKYDVSSPWGTVDISSNLVNLDVFGRVLATAQPGGDEDIYNFAAEVRLFKPEKVPVNERAA